jgi:hypothetical protein
MSDDQTMWAGSKWDDRKAPDECEVANEHGGGAPDEPHAEEAEGEREPSLEASARPANLRPRLRPPSRRSRHCSWKTLTIGDLKEKVAALEHDVERKW